MLDNIRWSYTKAAATFNTDDTVSTVNAVDIVDIIDIADIVNNLDIMVEVYIWICDFGLLEIKWFQDLSGPSPLVKIY